MDRDFPSEQLSLPHNSEDYPAHRPQAGFYPGNLQSGGTQASSIAPGSYLHSFDQFGPWDESEYSSIQQSVPSTPSDQSQFYPQPPFPSNDLSHAHDRVLDSSFEGHLIDNDTRYLAPMQAHLAAGWGSTNFRIGQDGTVDRLEAQRASGSDPSGSSSTMIADTLSSLSDDSDGFYPQYGVQDDYPHVTSSSHGQVEGVAQSHAVTQGPYAAKQEAIRRRREKKRENDRKRKEADRAGDDRAYSRVCKMLAVELDPKNTRSQRILKGVESIDEEFEKMCELLEISMTPKETLAHRILQGVEAMAEQRKLDKDLRHRLEAREAEVAFLRMDSFHGSTEAAAGSGLPINMHTELGAQTQVQPFVHGSSAARSELRG